MHDFNLHGGLDDIQGVWMTTITVAEIVDCESGVTLILSLSYPTVLLHKVWEEEAKATPI